MKKVLAGIVLFLFFIADWKMSLAIIITGLLLALFIWALKTLFD